MKLIFPQQKYLAEQIILKAKELAEYYDDLIQHGMDCEAAHKSFLKDMEPLNRLHLQAILTDASPIIVQFEETEIPRLFV